MLPSNHINSIQHCSNCPEKPPPKKKTWISFPMMDSVSLSSTITVTASTCTSSTTTTTTINSISTNFCCTSAISLHMHPRTSIINVCCDKKSRKVSVLASKGEPPELDRWEQMELKFGKMLGEDPKLTLAKIMARKANPDLTPLDVEKLFEKKKGKSNKNKIGEVAFDAEWERKSDDSVGGMNLVRPVTRKEVKLETNEKPFQVQETKPTQPVANVVKKNNRNVPNLILRKPSTYNDVDNENLSRFGMRPNLSLRMGKEQRKERISDITWLKKPEPLKISPDVEGEKGHSGDFQANDSYPNDQNTEKQEQLPPTSIGDQCHETKSGASNPESSIDAALLDKPKRLDQLVNATSSISKEQMMTKNPESSEELLELENFLSLPIKDLEEKDWKKAEDLVVSGKREEVEIISSSTRGFTVSFNSLVGFLPYRNLAAKWKFLAFESWLRRRGLDPSNYRKSLGVIGNSERVGMIPSPDLRLDPKIDDKLDIEISPDIKLEDLLKIYDQQKLKFLSSFVGQKIRVIVVLADRRSRRLVFSNKQKENEELIEKKRSLMAKLSVGDVVSCCIKKITYFGVFVEVEGVPALIHQTEVSWDATLDPASFFKVGQIVEAKVHQLDFTLERIFLSLKEVTPDPLMEALDAVVGDHDSSDGRLKEAQADTEWPEVESLIKELKQVEGIHSVSKGRYFVSPGLAPTFQVYMASMFENQYKLLARSGNRAQEVIVETSLGKEQMRSTILTCTNRVQ